MRKKANQSNIGIRFLQNLNNFEVFVDNDNDKDNESCIFYIQDKTTNEKFKAQILMQEYDDENIDSSTIIIRKIKDKSNKNINTGILNPKENVFYKMSHQVELLDKVNQDINEDSSNIEKEVNEVKDEGKSDEPRLFEYVKGNELNGIINYLNNQNNMLAHFKGTINVTSNGDERNHCFDLTNKNFNDYYYPHPDKNSFILFDFKNHKVSLKNYTLRSKNVFYNKLINWEIVGSDNAKQ